MVLHERQSASSFGRRARSRRARCAYGRDDNGLPYHLLEFDPRSLARLVRQAGFLLVRSEGSLPLPAELFKVAQPDLRTHALRGVFRLLDLGMRAGCLPPARVRLLARKPYD